MKPWWKSSKFWTLAGGLAAIWAAGLTVQTGDARLDGLVKLGTAALTALSTSVYAVARALGDDRHR